MHPFPDTYRGDRAFSTVHRTHSPVTAVVAHVVDA